MTSKAHVEFDPRMMGVRITLMRQGANTEQVYQWDNTPTIKTYTYTSEDFATASPESDWLRLPDDDARALYEALADYFGHTGHDICSLRKDYEAERGRVDRLITHLTAQP